MTGTFKIGMIKIMAATAAVIFSTFISACGSREAFTDVRAYRDAIDPDMQYTDDPQEHLMIDPPGTGDMDGLRTEAMEALNIINEERIRNNLAAMAWDADLEESAGIRAMEIASDFNNEHHRPDGSDWYTVNPVKILGENIYKGSRSADKALKSWMNNKVDRDNFLSDQFTHMGLSIYGTGDGEYFWAAEFGSDIK